MCEMWRTSISCWECAAWCGANELLIRTEIGLIEGNYRGTADVLVIQPSQKIGKHFDSASLNDDWVIDSAFLRNAKEALAIKEHFSKEAGMGGQSGCINLEPLALNLKKT